MFENMDILKIFFENPIREYGIREISRIIKISPSTASKILYKLHSIGLLKQKQDRMYTLYSADIDSEKYRDAKVYYNIQKIKDSGLLSKLNDFYLYPVIKLFGSTSTGYDTINSDIDLFIVSEIIKDFPKKAKYEKLLGKKIQIFVVKKITDIQNNHLVNNILNGITLQGSIEWTMMNVSKKDLLKKQ